MEKQGKHGEVRSGWGFLEGQMTYHGKISVNSIWYEGKATWKLMKFIEGKEPELDLYEGCFEWDCGKYIGNFFPHGDHDYSFHGAGFLIQDDVLIEGSWNKGIMIEEKRRVSMVIEDYTEKADETIRLRRDNPTQYALEVKRILDDLDFILKCSWFRWPNHLPGNQAYLYDRRKYEEFLLIRNKIIEIDKTTPAKKSRPATRSRSISRSVRNAVYRRDEGRCRQCGSNENIEYDHIIPHSKGGSNTERNIQLLCEQCNRKKSDKI